MPEIVISIKFKPKDTAVAHTHSHSHTHNTKTYEDNIINSEKLIKFNFSPFLHISETKHKYRFQAKLEVSLKYVKFP